MSRRRGRGGAVGQKKGWLIIGAALTALLVLFGMGIALRYGERDTDRATGCPTDEYESVTVALIDLTDSITPVQDAALRNALAKLRGEVPRFGRLEIYTLGPVADSTLEPLFAGCSPGSGRDVDNRYYGNPELADRLWRRRFADKVDAVIARLRGVTPQNASPIFEGIQSVVVTAFGAPIAERASSKRLVIISDMIHHTPRLSMYQGAPEFRTFQKTQYYALGKPMLRGAQVDVYLIVRETALNVQRPPLYKFWVEYMEAGDGYLRHWEPLQ